MGTVPHEYFELWFYTCIVFHDMLARNPPYYLNADVSVRIADGIDE